MVPRPSAHRSVVIVSRNNHLQDGISARGGLEPGFRVLFSASFQGVSLGNFHQSSNLWKGVESKV